MTGYADDLVGRGDLDGRDDPQWVQFKVNRGLLVHLQDDILFLQHAKTLSFRPDGVDCRAQAGQNVHPMIVAVRRKRDVRGVVGDGEGRVRNHGTALVRHHPSHLCRITRLAERGLVEKQNGRKCRCKQTEGATEPNPG